MILNSGKAITQKQLQILTMLFLLRGLLFEQLLRAMTLHLGRPLTDTYRQNTYKDLQKLESLKLINREWMQLDRRAVHFHDLTEEGLEGVYQALDILPGKRGKGFDEDFGEFPFALQRPPKGTGIHHHVLTADAFIEVERIKFQYPDHKIDWRDNRYCSTPYEWEGKTHHFKPDGELRVGGKTYLLEIDRGTEFLEALKLKFEGYDRYFSWLQSQGKELPAGVIVIHKNGSIRRWSTFLNAFFSKMAAWYLHFNMSFGQVEDIEKIVLKELRNTDHFNKFIDIIRHYEDENKGAGKLWQFNQQTSISCNGGMCFTVTQVANASQFFGYERFEFYETRALARLYELSKYARKQEKYKACDFIPVFYYFDDRPSLVNFDAFEDGDTLNALFVNPMWLRLKEEIPEWTDATGQRINAGNPLLSRVKNAV